MNIYTIAYIVLAAGILVLAFQGRKYGDYVQVDSEKRMVNFSLGFFQKKINRVGILCGIAVIILLFF